MLYGANNKEIDFWVWAKDPCRKTTLTVDPDINSSSGSLPVFIYFIHDTEKSAQFSGTLTAIEQDSQYGN